MAATPASSATRLAAGEYLGEAGSGIVQIGHSAAGRAPFTIDTRGANGHVCSLQGTLVDGRIELVQAVPDDPCRVDLFAQGDRVTVKVMTQTFSACRVFCGLRAGFEGDYRRPEPPCRGDRRRETQAAFLVAFHRRRYRAAQARLEPLLRTCEHWMDQRESGRVREDLAVTAYRLGDRAACRAILAPLTPDADADDAALVARYNGLPVEVEVARRFAGQTRGVLRLCRTARDARR
jgi:hypothetical protein